MIMTVKQSINLANRLEALFIQYEPDKFEICAFPQSEVLIKMYWNKDPNYYQKITVVNEAGTNFRVKSSELIMTNKVDYVSRCVNNFINFFKP